MTVTNTGVIYLGNLSQNSTGVSSLYSIGGLNQMNSFIISGDSWELTISSDGNVTWCGPLSKNVEKFLASISANIDLQTAGKHALAKNYLTVLKRCLTQIKSMERKEFIELLEHEIFMRQSKQVWNTLRESDEYSE